MSHTYQFPTDLPADQFPVSLVPEDQQGSAALTPTTPVVIRNRGRHTLRDKFDGRDYAIPPGPQTFLVPYGAAVHFKARLIQRGTRGPDGTAASMIGIINVDEPHDCEMLSPEEYDRAVGTVEAIDRSTLDPDRQQVKVLSVAQQRGAVAGQGTKRNMVERGRREEVFQPPAEGFVGTEPLRGEDGFAPGEQPDVTEHVEGAGEDAPAPTRRGRRG